MAPRLWFRTSAAVAALLLPAGASYTAAAQSGGQASLAAGATETVGGNLNISPKRLTLDRTHRTASVYIFNQGTASASFDIALIDRVMLPDGRITPLDEALSSPDQKPIADRLASAKPMLLASPRRVTLAPGKGQTIRVRAAPGADLAQAAEYRTHLTVTTVPPRDAGYSAEQAAALRPDELKFSVRSVFGLSIPIIVRLSDANVAARIENVRLGTARVSTDGVAPARPTPVVTLDLVRSGDNSLFGDVEIHGRKGRGSDLIGVVRGVGVYTEIDRRTLQIPLSRTPAKGEKLEVRFNDEDTTPGRLLAAGSVGTP